MLAVQESRLYLVGDEGESVSMGGTWFSTVSTDDYYQVFGFSDRSSGSSSSVAGLNLTFLYATKLH